MKCQALIAMIIVAILLILSSCSQPDLAYIPPVLGTVFTSSDEAWVLTRNGVLKRISINGQSINISDAQQRVQGMSFNSPTKAWTVDADWNTWHFDGVNWEFVGHNNESKFGLVWPSSVSFAGENVGWARTLNELFVTEDGGRTWKRVLVTELGAEPLGLFVVDRDAGFLYGERGSVKRTLDRGKTWRDIPLGDVGDVTSFACRNGEIGECWAGTARGELFAISKDSARSLPLPQTYGKIGIFSISFDKTSGHAYLAGLKYRDGYAGSGLLLRTDDEGKTWNKIEAPHNVKTDGGDDLERRVEVEDNRFVQVTSFGNMIWLASHSAIYRSADSGGSWVQVYDANH